mgnify:CR=1 FL=1
MIETLIAVAILMISIAGPLTIAQKGLTAAVYARDQVTASFLAQDAMEYMKNMRDYNVKAGVGGVNPLGWLTGFIFCSPSNPCAVDTYDGGFSQPGTESGFLLYHDGEGYRKQGTLKSQFTRKFYIEPVGFGESEVKAVVTVSWKNGTVENVVTLENQFFNVKR